MEMLYLRNPEVIGIPFGRLSFPSPVTQCVSLSPILTMGTYEHDQI